VYLPQWVAGHKRFTRSHFLFLVSRVSMSPVAWWRYGDVLVAPLSQREVWTMVCLEVIGVSVYAYVIGALVEVIKNLQVSIAQLHIIHQRP